VNCRNCGTELPTGALFCGECGTTVAVPRLVEPHTRPRPGNTAIIQPIDIRAPRLEFLEPDPSDLAPVRRDLTPEAVLETPAESAVEPAAATADHAAQTETGSGRQITDRAPADPARPSARARPRVPDPWPVADHSSTPVVEASFPTRLAPSAPAAPSRTPASASKPVPEPARAPAPIQEPAPAPVQQPAPASIQDPAPAPAIAPAAARARLTPAASAPLPPSVAPPTVRTPLTPPASVAPLAQAASVAPPASGPGSLRPANAAFESQHNDVEATRIVRAPQGDRFVLQFSTGENATVFGTGLVGRNPVMQPGEFVDQLVTIVDHGKSVSKTHLEFGQTSGVFWVVDRFSANGTVVRQPDAPPQRLDPGKRQPVARGTRVDMGEQFFVVS
jgi:hypothetical protein